MNKDDTQGIAPKITVEQALTRLLELIQNSKTTADFTSDRLQQAMGVPLTPQRDGYSFGERLSAQWAHGFGVTFVSSAATFDYNVSQTRPALPGQPSPALSSLCGLDFDEFTSELESMGFKRGSSYAEHNRRLYDFFERPGMRVEVYPRGESDEDARHDCVQMVLIH